MAYVGDVPWHGLGEKCEAGMSPQEFRVKAGLDWDVYKVNDHVEINGVWVPSGSQKLVRTSDQKIFSSSVTEEWNPLTVDEHFNFFEDICIDGGMDMHTAGSLRDGEIIWALAKIKEEAFELFGGDRVDSYLLLTNFFQYGRSTDCRWTPIRVVCNNTLSMALSKANAANSVRVSHRHPFNGEQVKEMLGVAREKLGQYKEMAEFLGRRKASKAKIAEYFKDVFPGAELKNEKAKAENAERASLGHVARMAYDALHEQPGAEYAEGSWWQPFNAVTYVVDHMKGRSNDTRMESAWYGNGMRTKNTALQKAIEYAEAE